VSSSSGFITLSDLTAIVIPASVTESDIGAVKVGDAASITFAALTDANDPNGTTVAGKVSEVDLTSTVTSSVVDYGVTISLSSVPSTLRLGQSATVTITTASKSNVLRLSSSAITTLGTRKSVTVQSGKTTSTVVVQTGVTGGGMTEITSGLTAGETVVLPSTTTTSTSSLLGGGAGTGSLLGGGR
jgi:multidrug efflux pump subunit AcrA (membrane-fusion protein)